ncbi:MAG: DNA-directed RNA polymerase subunit B', partial [Methanobacteriota archaeon]
MSTQESKVYVDGSLVGTHGEPERLVDGLKLARRRGEVSEQINVYMDDRTREVFVESGPGRARRPLIVVRDGEPMVDQEHIEMLEDGEIEFEDLVEAGLVEY